MGSLEGVFDSLSEKLQEAMAGVRERGTLTEDDIDKAMREIRLALLEADVNFKVVKQFTKTVKERCLGAEVIGQLNPGQQVVKIVNDELTALMGGAGRDVTFSPRPPTVILMAGPAGVGQDDGGRQARPPPAHGAWLVGCAGGLRRLPPRGRRPAREGGRAGQGDRLRAGHRPHPGRDRGLGARARDRAGKDVLIVDTSGRLHIDQELMDELAEIQKVKPHAVLLVVDAMTGQDAVNVAEQFAEAVQFDGVVMTKLDGDARGGAALSIKAVTGKPILYASTGEKLDEFERFHPDRMAQRILGMGDVLTFIEKAEQSVDADQAAGARAQAPQAGVHARGLPRPAQADAQDGAAVVAAGDDPRRRRAAAHAKIDEREIDRVEAIILSMTPEERRRPELIKGSRRLRIAKGSGTSVQAVNQLVKQFGQMRKLMKQIGQGKMPDLGALMRQAR